MKSLLTAGRSMRAVVDTSVFIAGLIKDSTCRQVIKALQESQFTLIVSSETFEEFLEVISRKKFHNVIDHSIALRLVETIRSQAMLVKPSVRVSVVVNDPDDNCFLEAALEAKGDCVVSVDKHLVSLGSFQNIPILRPAKFLKLLKR